MESRALKYMESNVNQDTNTRSSRNTRLYKEVYGKYGELENLPIQDNIDEIDISRLKEIVGGNKEKDNKFKEAKENNNIVKNNNFKDEQKIYDINKLLEQAKYENNKLKEASQRIKNSNKGILETLESRELSLDEIKEACRKYEIADNKTNDDLTMTREMKFRTKQISTNPLIEQVMTDNDLSFDIFEDLKPTGDTIVTKPIIEQVNNNNSENFYSSDTSDIDIIKDINNNSKKNDDVDDDFYTSSYKFSKKDFMDDGDFIDEKPNNFIKIILLILVIFVFSYLIYYFIKNYGIGV